MEGIDIIQGKVYEGVVYEPEVNHLINEYNSTILGETVADKQARIGKWQYDRIVQLIIDNLGFINKIEHVTTRLGGSKLLLVTNRNANPLIKGVQYTNTLNTDTLFTQQKNLLKLFQHHNTNKDTKYKKKPKQK